MRSSSAPLAFALELLLVACSGGGEVPAQPDAGPSCCGRCLAGGKGTYCVRCPGLFETCEEPGLDGDLCGGLPVEFLCECLVERGENGNCSEVEGVVIVTPSPEECALQWGLSGYSDDACTYERRDRHDMGGAGGAP